MKTGDNILSKSIKDNNENFARYLLLKPGLKIDFVDNVIKYSYSYLK